MIKCKRCARDIQEYAVYCEYCGVQLVDKPKVKWYFKTSVLVMIFLSVGPLVLPLIWFNPGFSRKVKITVSLIIIVLSYFFTVMLVSSLKSIGNYYQAIF